MNRYKQAPALVKIRTLVVIILSALVVSVVIELILAERTNALLKETVQGTTSLVKQVLSPVVPTAPAPTQTIASPAKSPSSTPQASPSSSPASTDPDKSVASSPVVTAPPMSNVAPIENANLQKLYFPKAKMSEFSATARLANVRDSSALPAAFTWLQATEQGWKFAGVLWYWWLAGVSAIAVSIFMWRQRIKQHQTNKLLYTQHILYAE